VVADWVQKVNEQAISRGQRDGVEVKGWLANI